MKLLLFLGNPGEKYSQTRHNAGFLCGEFLRKKWDAENWHFEKKFNAEISATKIFDRKILMARPQNFMNLSGESARKIVDFFHILPENVLLIFDDKDLNFGEIRFRETGSAGGHNGVLDVLQNLKMEEIARVKIGVETRATNSPISTADFVLQKFLSEEIGKLEKEIFPRARKEIEKFVQKI